jgi:hypothetical protein
VPVQLVARMDVRDMHLDDGAIEHLEGVNHGDRRERMGGRIDDDGVGIRARRVDEVDQRTLVI